MIDQMIQAFIEVRITYSRQHNQLPAVQLYLIVYLSLPPPRTRSDCVCLYQRTLNYPQCSSILLYTSHLLLPSKDKVRLCLPLPTNPEFAELIVTFFKKKSDRKLQFSRESLIQMCVTWLIHVWYDSIMYKLTVGKLSTCASWHVIPSDVCHVTHSCVCHVSHSFRCVSRDSFICETLHSHRTRPLKSSPRVL